MSLKDFNTFLLPTTKNAEIQFYQKPTTAFPKGRVLEAAYSRPGEGSTAYDKDGNLVELTENQPDWSFPLDGGCPRLLMRPQSSYPLIINNTFQVLMPWFSTTPQAEVVTFNWGAGTAIPSFAVKVDGSLGSTRLNISNSLYEGDMTRAGLFKRENGGPITDLSGFDFGSNAVSRNQFKRALHLGNDVYFVEIFTPAGAGNQMLVQQDEAKHTANGGAIFATGIIYAEGDVTLNPTDIIFSNGTALTRSANSFEFTDLITKGVYSTSGSFAIKADFARGTYTTDNTLLDLGTNNGIEISDYPDDNLSLVIKHAGTIIKRFNIPAGNNAFIFSWSPSGWKLFNSSSATPLDSGAEAIAVENNFNVYGRLYPVDIETISFAPIALDNAQGAAAWTELGQSETNALTNLGINWLLNGGVWGDTGVWEDTAVWID